MIVASGLSPARCKMAEVVLWLSVLAGLYLRWVWGDDFTYVVFTDRDLMRGLDLLNDFQVTGAELGGRQARTPGGMLSYFFHLLQSLNSNTEFVRGAVVALDCAALIAIPFLFAPVLGAQAALFAAALYGATPAVLESAWKFWNPSVTPPLAILIYWLILTCVRDGVRWRLPAAFFCIGIAQQFHVSFAYLLPITILVLIVRRCPLNVRTVTISVIAWALTLTPYLVVESLSGWPNTHALLAALNPETALPGSGSWVSHVLTVLSRLTGGRTFFGEAVPTAIQANILTQLGAFALFNLGLLLVVGFLVLAGLRRSATPGPEPAPGVTRSLILLFVIAVALGLSFDAAKAARYLLFIAVPGVLLAGLAFQYLGHATERLGHRAAVLFCTLVAAGLLARDVAVAAYYLHSERETLSSFDAKATMVALLKKTLGFTPRELETRVALVQWEGDRLVFHPEGENLGFTYIAVTDTTPAAPTHYDGCALIVVNPRRGTPPPAPDAAALASVLPVSGSVRIDRTARAGDILLIGYRNPGPNCPVTFGDAYHLLPEERVAETAGHGLAPGTARSLAGAGRAHRFAVRLSAGASFDMVVDITADRRALRAVLYSNAMRGYAPSFRVPRAVLHRPVLRFIGPSGAERSLAGPAALGQGGLKTPWVITGPPLVPGLYRVELGFDAIVTREGRRGPGAIALSAALSVP